MCGAREVVGPLDDAFAVLPVLGGRVSLVFPGIGKHETLPVTAERHRLDGTTCESGRRDVRAAAVVCKELSARCDSRILPLPGSNVRAGE